MKATDLICIAISFTLSNALMSRNIWILQEDQCYGLPLPKNTLENQQRKCCQREGLWLPRKGNPQWFVSKQLVQTNYNDSNSII